MAKSSEKSSCGWIESAAAYKVECGLAIAFSAAVAAATYIRLFWGISVADEAHYPAMANLPMMGARWFVEEKTFNQMSAMPLTPFLWVYTRFMGTDGVMLYFRHLHFLFSVLTSLVAFRRLKRFNRWPVAIVLSSMVIAFVPNGIASVNYNTMGTLAFGLGSMLAVLAAFERKAWMAVASGMAWVLSGFVYPSLAAVFGVFAASALWLFARSARDRREVLYPLIAGVAGSTVVLGGFLLSCGLEEIQSSVKYSSLFANPGSLSKLVYAFQMIWIYLPPVWLVIAIWVLWAVFALKERQRWNPLFLFVFLTAFFWLGGLYECMPNQVLWPVLVAMFPLYVLSSRFRLSEEEWKLVLLLILPSAAGAIVTCLTSRMTLYSMYITGFLGAIVVVSLFLRQSRFAGLFSAFLLCSTCTYWYYKMVYEDDPISGLTYRLDSGPFAGMYTNELKGRLIDGIQMDLKTAGIKGKSILFKDMFPGGYLMGENATLGPTLYFASANFYPEARIAYARIFQDRRFWPEVVVELKFYPCRTKELWPYNVAGIDPYHDPFRDFFMQTGEYAVLLDREMHRILVHRPDARH